MQTFADCSAKRCRVLAVFSLKQPSFSSEFSSCRRLCANPARYSLTHRLERKSGRAYCCLLGPRRCQIHAEHVAANPGPRRVSRPGAHDSHRGEGRPAKITQPSVSKRLDSGDTFQQPMQESDVARGARRLPRRELRIGKGEALAGAGQGVVIESTF